MIKSLQEIQQENRKIIIKTCNPEFDPERFNYLAYQQFNYLTYQLTLSKVLLSLKKTNITKDYSGQTFEIKLAKSIGENEINIVHDFLGLGFYNFVRWDLSKETLEEQSKETQRAIYQLLSGENESN